MSRSSTTRCAAGEAVSEIVSAGIVPGAIEMMDQLSIKASEEATGAGYRLDAGAALLVELDGPDDKCTARLEQVMDLCWRSRARWTSAWPRPRRSGR